MTSSQEPPLTRRELRERERLREQQATQATPDAAPAPASNPQPTAPPQPAPPAQAPVAPQPTPAAPPAQAPGYTPPRPAAGYDPSPFGGAVATPPSAPANPFAPSPGQPAARVAPAPSAPAAAPSPFEATTPERTLTRRELRAMLDANAPGDFHDLDLDDEPVAPAAPQAAPPVPAPAANPFASPPVPTRAPAPHQIADAAIADEPVAAPKPVGHWTDQLNLPADQAEPFDQLLSRGGVSHGVPTTSNALILPTLPDTGPMGNPLAKSGEVIATGSIDLPRSFGATGVHPSQIDSSDVDRLFDQVEDGAGVGAPVAATRAISTQNAARAMMAPPKKEGMNVPLVLAVTAGVLALGVVATLVIGAIAGLF